jgi:hypothetical protein
MYEENRPVVQISAWGGKLLGIELESIKKKKEEKRKVRQDPTNDSKSNWLILNVRHTAHPHLLVWVTNEQ